MTNERPTDSATTGPADRVRTACPAKGVGSDHKLKQRGSAEASDSSEMGSGARPGAGSLAFDSPRDDVYRVRVTGPFDAPTGNRLLRLIDARLRVLAFGGSPTRTIMVDLTHAEPAPCPGVDVLRHAYHACHAASISFTVLGAARLTARLPATARQTLGGIPSHPNLEAALLEDNPHHRTPPAR